MRTCSSNEGILRDAVEVFWPYCDHGGDPREGVLGLGSFPLSDGTLCNPLWAERLACDKSTLHLACHDCTLRPMVVVNRAYTRHVGGYERHLKESMPPSCLR